MRPWTDRVYGIPNDFSAREVTRLGFSSTFCGEMAGFLHDIAGQGCWT
jgi:hypothetical protein